MVQEVYASLRLVYTQGGTGVYPSYGGIPRVVQVCIASPWWYTQGGTGCICLPTIPGVYIQGYMPPYCTTLGTPPVHTVPAGYLS